MAYAETRFSALPSLSPCRRGSEGPVESTIHYESGGIFPVFFETAVRPIGLASFLRYPVYQAKGSEAGIDRGSHLIHCAVWFHFLRCDPTSPQSVELGSVF